MPASRRAKQNARALVRELDRIFATRDLAHWRRVLDEAGLIFGIVAETHDIATDEQVLAAGHLVRFTDAEYMTVNSPIEIGGQEKVPPRRAPDVGEHSEQVLREAGYARYRDRRAARGRRDRLIARIARRQGEAALPNRRLPAAYQRAMLNAARSEDTGPE